MTPQRALLCTWFLLPLASCGTGGMDPPRTRQNIRYSGTLADSMTEGRRTLEGRVLIQPPATGGHVEALVVTASGERTAAKWPDRATSSPVDPSQVYRVELLTRVYRNPDYVFNDVLRISAGDQVLIDASVCDLHQLPMQRRIEDGKSMESYPESFFPLRQKTFPHDGNAYLACGSGIRHPTWKCPECSRRYHAWTRQHGVDENG